MNNQRFLSYSVTDNATGESWTENLTELDARFIGVSESLITEGLGFDHSQVYALIRSLNIAQGNHKGEFSYSLPV